MVGRRFHRWLCTSLLVLASQGAFAAPAFIAGSRVSGDESTAAIEIRFKCQVSYVQHSPQGQGDRLRIQLEPTAICNGVSPVVAQSRGRYRPNNADVAGLVDFEYEGDSPEGPVLTLNFSEPVSYTVDAPALAFELVVNVRRGAMQPGAPIENAPSAALHKQVLRPAPERPEFVINLVSFQRIPTIADVPNFDLAPDQRLFYSEAVVSGTSWYRLRLGDFASAEEARVALGKLSADFPGAWIDRLENDAQTIDLTVAAKKVSAAPAVAAASQPVTPGQSAIDALMEEARLTMVSGDRSRAIQIYTKILQMPPDPRQMEAQEYLALAREKNGQIAHAKAEYQRYLSLYPESEGAPRVSQRLAALLAGDRQAKTAAGTGGSSSGNSSGNSATRATDWRMQTFFSQYYRRDVNQQTDQDEIVSQSALYSDVNFDARRRGERFDFSSRLTAGYRSDFLGEEYGSGNDIRVTYAYADLADAATGLRGRIGRQSRNSGGVLGRFDGVNMGYQASESILLNAVVGKPAYSSNSSIDAERTFYGLSADYGPIWDGLEVGLFFIAQEIDGITDRQAVGGEFRYFSESASLWGLLDYDTRFNEVGSSFLQASWRVASRLTLNGSFDKRHSPFLTTGNAMIGQPVTSFSELADIFSEDELLQIALDRSPLATSYSLGVSYSLTPKLQLSADANETSIAATPTSGGVFGTEASTFRYIATNIVASSLLTEGDVTIFGARRSESDTSNSISIWVDSRFPLGNSWRINPRLRVDRRERVGDTSDEWIYTPGIRIQYRRSQKFRIELEGGKQFVQRETEAVNLDRESYFINLGYQAFF